MMPESSEDLVTALTWFARSSLRISRKVTRDFKQVYSVGRTPRTARGIPMYVMMSTAEAPPDEELDPGAGAIVVSYEIVSRPKFSLSD
jgi:hypothetical protein